MVSTCLNYTLITENPNPFKGKQVTSLGADWGFSNFIQRGKTLCSYTGTTNVLLSTTGRCEQCVLAWEGCTFCHEVFFKVEFSAS